MAVSGNDEVTGHLPVHPVSTVQRVTLLVRERWWVLILALTAFLRFYDATAGAIWCDEGSSLLLSGYPLTDIWYHAAHDVHPPLYFFLLHLWITLFGDGLLAVRTLSVLPGIATVALGIWLVRLIATPRAAMLAGVLLALLPTAVRYSQEVRMYSLMGFWLLGATIALVYWVKEPQRTRYLMIYGLLMTVGFYTHYFTVFCVLSHWSYLLLLRLQSSPRRDLILSPAWWLVNGAIVLLYSPWIPGLVDLLQHMHELKAGGDVGWEPPVTASSLPSMMWQFLIQDEGDTLPWPIFIVMPLGLLVVILATVLSDSGPYKFDGLVGIYCILPLLAIFSISFITPIFIERYLTYAALGLPILWAIAIDRLWPRFRALAAFLLVLIVGLEMVGLKNNYTYEEPQFDSVVNYVNQHYIVGDRIVVSDLFWYFSFVYYNKTGAEPLLWTPPLADGESGRPNGYGFGSLVQPVGEKIYVDQLQTLPSRDCRVWLVSGQGYEFTSIPVRWQKLSEWSAGDTRTVLYSTCGTYSAGH